jgi:hypothetical protein
MGAADAVFVAGALAVAVLLGVFVDVAVAVIVGAVVAVPVALGVGVRVGGTRVFGAVGRGGAVEVGVAAAIELSAFTPTALIQALSGPIVVLIVTCTHTDITLLAAYACTRCRQRNALQTRMGLLHTIFVDSGSLPPEGSIPIRPSASVFCEMTQPASA